MVKWLLEQGIDLNVSEEELSLLGKFIQESGCSDGLWKNL